MFLHEVDVVLHLVAVYAFLSAGVLVDGIVAGINQIVDIIFSVCAFETSVKRIVSDDCVFIRRHSISFVLTSRCKLFLPSNKTRCSASVFLLGLQI